MQLKNTWFMIYLILFFLSCEESLPLRITPQNTLEITKIIANQEANGGIFIAIYVCGENKYVDTFEDTVNVSGNIHIWWARKPEIEAHVPLNNTHFIEPTRIQSNILTLDPGEKFHLETKWYLYTDDRISILDLLDFSNSPVIDGIVTAQPEKFILQVQLTLFQETGLLRSQPHEFFITGWKVVTPQEP